MAVLSGGASAVQKLLDQANELKQQVANGTLKLVDFQGQLAKIVADAADTTAATSRGGSQAANSVNPIWQQFQNSGFVANRAGQWVPTMPFSQQEYAKLPETVLPTQTDAKTGMFDPTGAPLQRYRQDQQPQIDGGLLPKGPSAPGGTPLPQIDTQLPGGVDARTEQGQIALQGSTNAKTLQDALNQQFGVNQQAIEQLKQGLQGVPDIYRQEGTSQQQQLNALAEQQKAARATSLTDLADILAKQQQQTFNTALPNLAEQANTSGIYRSTGFGDQLARYYSQLEAQRQNQLALQGLSDREAYLGAQQGALQTGLGWSGQGAMEQAGNQKTIAGAGASALQSYGSGLGDVANAMIQGQNAGLQRQFSLSDFYTQQRAANDLASKMAPAPQTGKASPGTQAAIGTGLGVAKIGAGVGKAAMGNPTGLLTAGSGAQDIGGGRSTLPGFTPY